MPAYPHEVEEAEGERVGSSGWPSRCASSDRLSVGAVECRAIDSASPTRAAAADRSAIPGSEFSSLPTRWSRQSDSGRAASTRPSGLDSDVDPVDGTGAGEAGMFAGGTPERRRDRWKPCGEGKIAARPSTSPQRAGPQGDPLARTRGAGSQDRVTRSLWRCCRRASTCRRFPSTGRSAAGRPSVPTRASPTVRSGATTRDRPDLVVVLEPSLVREVDVAEGLRAEGLLLVNAERCPKNCERGLARCVPAARSPNLVMLGAVAAAPGLLAERPGGGRGDAREQGAVEEIRAALAEGYTCLR